MTQERVLFECENFSLFKNGRMLFEPISMHIPFGKVVLISGINGIGKSSFLDFLNGQKQNFSGTVKFRPNPKRTLLLTQLHAPKTLLPYSLAEVAQLISMTSHKTQKEDEIDADLSPIQDHTWFPEATKSIMWNNASGGERMRALMSGALRSRAEVLLLDEPFNHLDQTASEAIEHAILDHSLKNNFTKKTIFLVSHNQTPLLSEQLGETCITLTLKPNPRNHREGSKKDT